VKIAVLGDGAWGTACAHLLATNGYPVTLWCYNKEVATAIETTRCNTRFLPFISLPPSITPTTDIQQALENALWIFEAIPVKFLRSIISTAAPYALPEQPWVILSKGIEQNSLFVSSEIIQASLKRDVPYVVLSGPSFAKDLVHKQPTGVMLASKESFLAKNLQALINNKYVTSMVTTDTYGVQLCGALKNLIALALGIIDGLGYGDNTKALAATLGLSELEQLVVSLGGQRETVYSLAGVGDVILTAFSIQSRNVLVGKELGQGKTVTDILSSMAQVPESINTLASTYELIKKHSLELPLFTTLYSIVYDGQPAHSLLQALNKKALR
jgi:glycerol-3-phosphate dehydrogenase (NAD(P)+)